MAPKVLYAMASWSGSRELFKFDDSYVEQHIEQLKRVKHNLTQISIGNPENPTQREEFNSYIRSLKEVSGVPVVVHDVPNIGRSYGQWARIYEKYRTQFDYYIFIEDDYQPVIDNFDKILIDMYEEKGCGFLCGLVLGPDGKYGLSCGTEHAGISNGIASSKALEKVWQKFGCLPHDKEGYEHGQILFSSSFIKAGMKIDEYIGSGYRSIYHDRSRGAKIYGSRNGKDIFLPAQIVGKDTSKFVCYDS